MHAELQPGAPTRPALATRERMQVMLLFTLIVISILAIVWPVTRSMVDTWQHSSTYGHGYVVIPVAIWMVWRESAARASISLKPFWP